MASRGNFSNRSRGYHQQSQSNPRKRPAADDEEDAWVAEEDTFVLRQAKKRAVIRVRGGRARPIDWLAVTLRAIDATEDILDDNDENEDLDVVDPEGVFEGLDQKELEDLARDIDTYLVRETSSSNREFWTTMKVICKDRLERFNAPVRAARGVSSVTSDVDRLFSPKSYEELEVLEKQIRGKLDSNESIDVDYWEHLLRSLLVWKAKARLKKVSQEIVNTKLQALRKQQLEEANAATERLGAALSILPPEETSQESIADSRLDPDPLLKLPAEYRGLETIDEAALLRRITEERRKVLKLGYIPNAQRGVDKASHSLVTRPADASIPSVSRFAPAGNEDFSRVASALYEREVARGVDENEEIFAGEESVAATSSSQLSNKYRPRKPRYFNRVQMGYEWNKYNQTHYDHDNPPPKVVQGYKFNIFYPDLIDQTKAPTYRIEREGGRKRGQTSAPAGEEDTCLIRFVAGPPYEDIAFRIVDREWDYSAKRDRGFKSSFDKGILQLHFQFKKVYYRK